jgi:hypothetical protein
MKAERAAKRKPGQEGFLERMQRIAEDQQKNRTKSAYNQPKKK